MSNETYITVRGYAGADPVAYDNGNGLTTVVARVGVTARIRDRETHRYRDGTTSWYSVRCYGDLGLNVSRSVRRGTPVLVRGRLVERAWTAKDGAERTDLSIIADALGVELSSGVATFVKVRHTSVDSNGRPVPEARHERRGRGGRGPKNRRRGAGSRHVDRCAGRLFRRREKRPGIPLRRSRTGAFFRRAQRRCRTRPVRFCAEPV